MGILFRVPVSIAATNWLAKLGGVSNDYAAGVTIDSSGNTYIVGNTDFDGVGPTAILLAKYNPAGVLQWQEALVGDGVNTEGTAVAAAPTGHVYVCGFNSVATSEIVIAKCDSAGGIVWSQTVSGTPLTGLSIAVDADFVYVGSQNNVSWQVMKLDLTGAMVWQRIFHQTAGSHTFAKLHVDTAGNIYLTGNTNYQTQGFDDLVVIKVDSSGTVVWQQALGGIQDDRGHDVTVDSSGNVFVAGFTSSNVGTADAVLVKYSSAGTLLWQRAIGGGVGDSTAGHGVATDAAGNAYIVGSYNTTGVYTPAFIAKYDASGNAVWNRTLGTTDTGDFDELYGAHALGSDLYVAGYAYYNVAGAAAITAALPQDGTPPGTYNGFVYQAGGMTSSTPTLTAYTPTFTTTITTASLSSTTLTATATSMTASTTPIP